eukprot:1575410-Alexandrium_andersonii.AAC.1
MGLHAGPPKGLDGRDERGKGVQEGLPPVKPATLERPIRSKMLGSVPACFIVFGPVLPLTASASKKRCEEDVEQRSQCEQLEGRVMLGRTLM